MRIDPKLKGWYVLYVKSRHEKKINDLLRENQVETFLPLVKTVRQWSDRKKIIQLPLFPSYIFVNINLKKDSEKVLTINGFCSFIRFGKEFAKLRECEINAIRVLTELDLTMEIENSDIRPQVGEFRKIEVGALGGLECEVINIDNENKVIVRINSINQNILATIPSSYFTQPVAV